MAAGSFLVASGLVVLWSYPVARLPLILLALTLLVAQWLKPTSWLLAVPPVLAFVDLGAWSGRLLFNEQDALLAVLAGSAMAAGQYSGTGDQMRRRSFWPLWLFALALAVGFVRGLLPLTQWDANAWHGYLTGWNALRVAKGALWALIFAPLLAVQMAADRAQAELRLGQGLVVALVGFGVFVLWERGFFADVVTARNVWGLVASWLDLSGRFRIAGPSSQMHLGGEAVDGILILTWPFALWMGWRAKAWPALVLALFALALALYAVMVTFTRMTYVAFGLSLLVFLVSGLAGGRNLAKGQLVTAGGYVLLASALFIVGFRFGGSVLLLGYLLLLIGGIVAGRIPRSTVSLPVLAGVLTILLAIGAALAMRGVLTSKWSDVSLGKALVVVAPSGMILLAGGFAFGRTLRSAVSWRQMTVLLGCLALLLPAGALSLSGYQMQSRIETVGQDLESRKAHWQKGLSLLGDDLGNRILGQGLGTFPRTNLMLARDHREGIWYFVDNAEWRGLRLVGTGSLCVGQRLGALTLGRYSVFARVRNPSDKNAALAIKLQPRRMLEAENWQPSTVALTFRLAAGSLQWQEVHGHLDLTASSSPPWHSPRRPVFVVTNYGADASAIDISELRLVGPDGEDVLVNGNFATGGDRWFAYNDFSHLPWHLKNLYVALYFDLGLLGVVTFLILVLVAVWRSLAHAVRGYPFRSAAAAAIIGFLALGAAGTLLDVPPLMTIFLLLATAGLWRERVQRPSTDQRSASTRVTQNPGSQPP
ncbi:MAG: hypothetical protein V5B34_05910 [Accumulibacter sp.]|jgi:hypothetical protein